MKQKKYNIKIKFVALALIIVVLAIIGATTFIINNNKNNKIACKEIKGTLCIIVSGWSGWGKGGELGEEKYNYKISENYIFEIDSLIGKKSFTVTNIYDDKIVISLPQGVIQTNDGGGINLLDKSLQNITVKTNGEEIKASTQTLDSGTTFMFKYIK